MYEIIFLLVLGGIWIIFANIQDLRSREIANWLNFSLIIFILGFRFFYCLFSQGNFGFFYQGLIGLGIFFILGNLLYYGRMFAGGDAKLMIALGVVLPFSESFLVNIKIFVWFFSIFLISGAIYGLVISVILGLKNSKKVGREFYKQLKKNKKLPYIMFLGLFLMIFGFIEKSLFVFGILVFILPYFYAYAKAIEEVCMIKKIKTNQLREGDWLYRDLKVGKKFIRANWDGLSKEQIKDIKKRYKEIKIKQGIPFTPVFLISFLVLICLKYWLKLII
jgi:Flp pilus assembly protein protease CpaA